MKILSVAVSAAILVMLYRSLDLRGIGRVLTSASPVWLLVSVGMIVPIVFLSALRFRWVAPTRTAVGMRDAGAMTVIAIALNFLLPAKLGDLSKSHYLYRTHGVSPGLAISVVVYERLCDVFSVATWCLLGWLSGLSALSLDAVVLPALLIWVLSAGLLFSGALARVLLSKARSWRPLKRWEKLALLAEGWPDLLSALGWRSPRLVLYSVALWLVHLTQVWLFTLAVGATVPFAACLTVAPIILLCGQVPFTLGGIGPRDAAVIYFFSPYMSPELAASVGLLTISRSIVPALAGLPFLRRYVATLPEKSPTRESDR